MTAPIRTLFGVETEYAVTGWDQRGNPYPRNVIVQSMLSGVRDRLPSLLHTEGRGFFLANGSRFLLDAGDHPEYATPECRDPWELLAHLRAGERIVKQLADFALDDRSGLATVSVFRTNTSPGPPPTSWACHENYYCANQPPARLFRSLMPHLVSRVILTGAGGFRPDRREPEFTLSPRACFFVRAGSDQSVEDRGIFSLRDEPLSQSGYRLHVVTGESLCSDVAILLKVGTTALVAALADQGLVLVLPIQLVNPVSALRDFAKDPSCRVRVACRNGTSISAIEIQRHYLGLAEAHLDILPDWAGTVCGMWRSHLDQLEADPRSARTLDWVIKLALLERSFRGRPAGHALFEIDARFGELGKRGIFDQLVARGVLGQPQVTEGAITAAVTTPPRRTRAWRRGRLVAELAVEPTRRMQVWCDWHEVLDVMTGQSVTLGDPFQGEGAEVSWAKPVRSEQLPLGIG